MLLKIGELARLTGLTIRTLHHYDSIGLLSPSARTQAGYRLYQHSDMDRLHRIMALRKFGLSLADIANALAGPDLPLSAIVAQQIAMLDRQIAQASTLRARLRSLQSQLAQGQAPELAEWFTTMELMTMYDKYFSPEELQQIPLLSDAAVEQEWKELVARVRAVKDAGASRGHGMDGQAGARHGHPPGPVRPPEQHARTGAVHAGHDQHRWGLDAIHHRRLQYLAHRAV